MRFQKPKPIFAHTLWLCFILFLSLYPRTELNAQQKTHKVLILNSYHQGFEWSDEEMRGLEATLPEDTDLYVEYMDTKRQISAPYLTLLYETYQYKYKDTHFDCIITLDDNAFEFILRYHEDLFPDTPIVFGGVNYFNPSMLQGHQNVIGVVETVDIEGTLNLALQLHPDTEQIFVISDQTTSGLGNRATLEALIREGKIAADVVFLDQGNGLDLEQVISTLQTLPQHSVVYYADFFQDQQQRFLNYEETMPILSKASTVPIYVHAEFYLDYGATGGKVISGFYHAQAVGQLVTRILQGETASQIPVQPDGGMRYMFNYEQLEHWHIPISAIPKDSIIKNQPATDFYEKNKTLLWGTLIFLAFEIFVSVYLLLSVARRKKAEAALAYERDLLHALLDNIPDTIYFKDTQSRFTRINQAQADTLGIADPAEAIGKTDFDFFTPEHAQDAYHDEQNIIRTGRPVLGKVEKIRQASGKFIWVSATKVPIFDKEGNVSGIVGVSRDIHERKLAEDERKRLLAQIRQQAQQMQLIMDAVPEGVLLLNVTRQVLLTNPSGRAMLEVLTKTQPGDALTHLGEHPLAALLDPPTEGLWHKIEHRGHHFRLLAKPVEVKTQDSGWVIVIRDVTREYEIQQHLQQQERLAAVGQLAAGLAHDFNNIMAVITLYAQLMARAHDPNSRDYERLCTINAQAKHASDLIEQILDFGRRAIIARQKVDLVSFFEEQVDVLRGILPENIQITLVHDHLPYIAQVDPTRLQQAVTNLASNARDAMPAGGEVYIELQKLQIKEYDPLPLPELSRGHWICIIFRDTGTGIHPDLLPHIFDPFVTTKGPDKGVGLGLAQVYGIVKLHDGAIAVESEVNVGTTFTIYLPAAE